jgi:hypothetical protein
VAIAALLPVTATAAPRAPDTPPEPTAAASLPASAVSGSFPAPADAVPPDPAPASFLIEKIVVTGVRHGSEGIVASETLLRPGSTYTESQLREALHRVERLPFVVSADFSLRRGSERGRLELVIAVVETKPVFFGGVLTLAAFGDGSEVDWGAMASPEIGARTFFGQSGELTGTVTGIGAASGGGGTSTKALFNVAVRHHDLFGRRIVGTLFAGVPQPSDRQAGAELAIPLKRTSVLTIAARQTRARVEFGFEPADDEFSRSTRSTTNRAEIAWRRDTTDDPFAPRQGDRLEAQGFVSSGHGRVSSNADPWSGGWAPGRPEVSWTQDSESDRISGALSARHYWPLTSRLAIGAGASLTGLRDHQDGTTFRDGVAFRDVTSRESSVGGTAEIELLGELPRDRCGTDQCWWYVKTALTGAGSHTRWDPPRQYTYPTPVTYTGSEYSTAALTLSVGVAARGRWGSFRLELWYVHQLRSRYEMR